MACDNNKMRTVEQAQHMLRCALAASSSALAVQHTALECCLTSEQAESQAARWHQLQSVQCSTMTNALYVYVL